MRIVKVTAEESGPERIMFRAFSSLDVLGLLVGLGEEGLFYAC